MYSHRLGLQTCAGLLRSGRTIASQAGPAKDASNSITPDPRPDSDSAATDAFKIVPRLGRKPREVCPLLIQIPAHTSRLAPISIKERLNESLLTSAFARKEMTCCFNGA